MAPNELTTLEHAPVVRVTFSPEQIELIKATICRGATDDELRFFLYQAERTQLDPFNRQIYSIVRRSKNPQSGQWESVRQTQVAIDGFRVIAERTGRYRGQIGPQWCGGDGVWHDVWLDEAPPSAARVGVLRSDFTEPLWGTALLREYCQTNSAGVPTHMWDKFPSVMIAKCAEAIGLRRAFPQQLSGLYTPDEMMQAEHPPAGQPGDYNGGPAESIPTSLPPKVEAAATVHVPPTLRRPVPAEAGPVVYPPPKPTPHPIPTPQEELPPRTAQEGATAPPEPLPPQDSDYGPDDPWPPPPPPQDDEKTSKQWLGFDMGMSACSSAQQRLKFLSNAVARVNTSDRWERFQAGWKSRLAKLPPAEHAALQAIVTQRSREFGLPV